jgi:hypothetical protein
MRHKLRVMSVRGDDTVITWDPKVEEEVKVAEFEFQRHAKTMLAFTDTVPADQIREFKPNVDIIMTPQLQGG